MPNPIKLEPHHSPEVLWQAYKASTCPVERRRLQTVALLAEGKTPGEVQAITRYSQPRWQQVVHRYNAQGLAGLRDLRHDNTGAPFLLDDGQILLLAQSVRADYALGVLWNGHKVQQWLRETCGLELHLGRSYELLTAIGFSVQSPRPVHVQVDEQAQADRPDRCRSVQDNTFKKTP